MAFRAFRIYRIIEDIPTSQIRSAPQGYIELTGTVKLKNSQTLLTAPLTGKLCHWYEYEIAEKCGKSWKRKEHGISEQEFVLADITGECLILPEAAEVTTTEDNHWYGNTEKPLGKEKKNGLLAQSMSKYRYTEKLILPGEKLYAIGQFHTNAPSENELDNKSKVFHTLSRPEERIHPFVLSTKKEFDLVGHYRRDFWLMLALFLFFASICFLRP